MNWKDPIIIALKANGDSTIDEVAYLLMGMNQKYSMQEKKAIVAANAAKLGGAVRMEGNMLRISHWFRFPKTNGGKL